MSQVNYQATYKYFTVYMLEMVHGYGPRPDLKQQIKGTGTWSYVLNYDQ